MRKFIFYRYNNEDGAVLITSLLFLMVVTVLALVGMQSPKTDIMISGNEKLAEQAQQLANMGVFEAKNWLSLHYRPNAIPLNAADESDPANPKLFVVVRPNPSLDSDFSRFGILKEGVNVNFVSENGTRINDNNFNSPSGYSGGAGLKQITSSDYTLKDGNKNIGLYEWNIVRVSQVGVTFDPSVREVSKAAVDSFMMGRGAVASKFTMPLPITEGYNAAIGEDKAFWQYFYINSEGHSGGLTARAEGVASYKQIIPSSD